MEVVRQGAKQINDNLVCGGNCCEYGGFCCQSGSGHDEEEEQELKQ